MIQINIIDVMSMVTAVFTALAGIALLFVGLSHFSGTNTTKGISIFYLMIPLWCGVHLIDRFLKHTATPVDAADTMDLIMFVALAMFFINATMVHVLIPGKNAVKASVTFGFPAIVSAFVYGVSLIFNVLASDSNAMIDFIPAVGYIIIGLYVLGFTSELSFKAKSVEEQLVVEFSEEETESKVDVEDSVQTADGSVDETSFDAVETSVPFEEAEVSEMVVTSANESSFDSVAVFDEAVQETAIEEETSEELFVEEEIDIPAKLPEPEDASEFYVAEELFREAQQKDTESENTQAVYDDAGSEDEMIIDGKDKACEPIALKSSTFDSRPKGPTIREAVMYDDEDFILTVESGEGAEEVPPDRVEDISSVILEKEEPEAPKTVEKTYADRLDEIDQLIISIQGGDSVTED